MTEELKKHLSKLLSHSYQMGRNDGYTQGFKDAQATLQAQLSDPDIDQVFGEYEFSGFEKAAETLKTANMTLESSDKVVRKIMDDALKKLWGELERMLSPEVKVNPLDNTFLNGLIKSEVP